MNFEIKKVHLNPHWEKGAHTNKTNNRRPSQAVFVYILAIITPDNFEYKYSPYIRKESYRYVRERILS